MLAAEEGHTEICALLVSRGANINLGNEVCVRVYVCGKEMLHVPVLLYQLID